MKSRLVQYVIEALRSPRESLTRGQHFVRHSIELTVHCYGQLQHHRAEGMAAELTYRTIFSLIPVVVLGLVMFRVFGGLDEVQSQVENQLYSFFGVPEIAEGYERPFLEESPMESDDG
ncbi:MAG: ribonuclease BN, partial [Planctomycetota bacterium]